MAELEYRTFQICGICFLRNDLGPVAQSSDKVNTGLLLRSWFTNVLKGLLICVLRSGVDYSYRWLINDQALLMFD